MPKLDVRDQGAQLGRNQAIGEQGQVEMVRVVGGGGHAVQGVVILLDQGGQPVRFVPRGQHLAQGPEFRFEPAVAAQAGMDVAQHAQLFHARQPGLRLRLLKEQEQLVTDALAADPPQKA